MKKLLLNSLVTIIVALAVSMIFQSTSKAQSMSFEHVIPFVNTVGYVGFFDQSNGMIYVYDGNVEKCILNVQLQKLGEPARTLKNFSDPYEENTGGKAPVKGY